MIARRQQWQQETEWQMLRMMSSNTPAQPPGDFGVHEDWDYVVRTVQFLEWFQQWPDGGGWQDQPSELVEDVIRYKNREQYLRQEFKPNDKDFMPPAMPVHKHDDVDEFEARWQEAGMKVEELG